MPIHVWTRVDAELFHGFHFRWIGALCNALNEAGLPPDYFALPEQSVRTAVPDVMTLERALAVADRARPQPQSPSRRRHLAPGSSGTPKSWSTSTRPTGCRYATGSAVSWP
jgi:hypothetical protein